MMPAGQLSGDKKFLSNKEGKNHIHFPLAASFFVLLGYLDQKEKERKKTTKYLVCIG